ncbi:hypothetical protein [Konateibacter massiliensis]|uniref:hypothetical protein n=1 Tax=Konateibacter massiliensis TaxID=2002841 RepID=UPI000C157415|nr:hypothetical protein [Konateibacter massiliensis]
MANTINTNVIVPEVYAQLVREKITGKTKVAQFAKVLGDLQGKPGETLTMPKWSYVGDAKDWAINTPMESTQMTQTSTTATIKAIAAPAVKIADYDNEVELGNAVNEAAGQQGVSIARKQDTDAIAECLTSPLKFKIETKNTVSQLEMISILGLYGDDRDSSDFDAIVIHSSFAPSFYLMDMFTSKEKTMTTDGNGIAVNGVIGYFLDIPVILSDRLYDATNTEGFLLIMKKGALGLIPKEAPFAEASRDASLRQTTIYCSQFYALALIDDEAVVYAKTVI